MPHANDWNQVRRALDNSDHFDAIFNSPWYADAVYDKFSDAEFARRHEAARTLMVRDGLDAVIFTGGPDIYSHGAGVTWGSGLFDERGMVQYLLLPLKGEPTWCTRTPAAISRPRAGWFPWWKCAGGSTGTTAGSSPSG